METIEARILLKNLFKRLSPLDDGCYVLDGKLTADEVEALRMALTLLEGGAAPRTPPVQPTPSAGPATTPPAARALRPIPSPVQEPEPEPAPGPEPAAPSAPRVNRLDIEESVKGLLSLPDAPEDIRLCLDFGTAMSKATLVKDGEDDWDDEEITVLELGRYGDDEEDYKLISSVYIDDDGKLWFGKEAEENCASDSPDGERQVMDNIKHWLSLGQVDETVDGQFNPTAISVTYADVILAYLTFLTWTVNQALEQLDQPPGGYPRNLNRRFAMPCLSGAELKEVKYRLQRYLGEAQVLADVFYKNIRSGLSLEQFVGAVKTLRDSGRHEYGFVREGITEPLGVAGSLLNYASDEARHMVVMVMDIGAGTSDFSVYQMRIDPENNIRVAQEAKHSVGGVTEAGNHLDSTLMGLLYVKLGFEWDETCGWEQVPRRVRWTVSRRIREYKEDLFDRGAVFFSADGYETEVTLEEFLQSRGVQDFKRSLDNEMVYIMERIDPSWVDLIGTAKVPYLTVVLTGGGAALPMVRELADREMRVGNRQIRVASAKSFPTWLAEAHGELELDYPRVAVSLGGARKKLVRSAGAAQSTAAGAQRRPTYDDPKYQW